MPVLRLNRPENSVYGIVPGRSGWRHIDVNWNHHLLPVLKCQMHWMEK